MKANEECECGHKYRKHLWTVKPNGYCNTLIDLGVWCKCKGFKLDEGKDGGKS